MRYLLLLALIGSVSASSTYCTYICPPQSSCAQNCNLTTTSVCDECVVYGSTSYKIDCSGTITKVNVYNSDTVCGFLFAVFDLDQCYLLGSNIMTDPKAYGSECPISSSSSSPSLSPSPTPVPSPSPTPAPTGCTQDSDCDDGIDCTTATCESGYCIVVANNSLCTDEFACTFDLCVSKRCDGGDNQTQRCVLPTDCPGGICTAYRCNTGGANDGQSCHPNDFSRFLCGGACNTSNYIAGCANYAFNCQCGNGILEPGEQCDDNNVVSGDGCSSTCQIEDVCNVTCGCPYSQGYWGTKRFRAYPYTGKKSKNVANTCSWPLNSSIVCTTSVLCDQHLENDVLHCGTPTKPVTKYTVMTSNAPNNANNDWWNAMKQSVALQLNFLNGFCAEDCTGIDCGNENCDLVREFYDVDIYPFVQDDGQSCTVPENTVIGTCSSACTTLCGLFNLSGSNCTMGAVAQLLDEGETDGFPEHCTNIDVNQMGCCTECSCYPPACDPAVIQALSTWETTETDEAEEHEAVEIADLVFSIVAGVGILGIAILLFIAFCRPGSKWYIGGQASSNYQPIPLKQNARRLQDFGKQI